VRKPSACGALDGVGKIAYCRRLGCRPFWPARGPGGRRL